MPQKVCLGALWKISQLTMESTDARLLGARHMSLNCCCFLQTTVKKYSIENWKEIFLLNPHRALTHSGCACAWINHCNPSYGVWNFAWRTASASGQQAMASVLCCKLNRGRLRGFWLGCAGHSRRVLQVEPSASLLTRTEAPTTPEQAEGLAEPLRAWFTSSCPLQSVRKLTTALHGRLLL